MPAGMQAQKKPHGTETKSRSVVSMRFNSPRSIQRGGSKLLKVESAKSPANQSHTRKAGTAAIEFTQVST